MNRPCKCLHWRDAILLLESGKPCTLKVWKISTGDIITYHDVVCTGRHWRGGTHTITLPASNLKRTFRDITLFEINGYEVIR
ncbi:hypothetical protein IMSAGC008_02057 [Muribaculaceae bacterium]|nr:hypothetical protein IMSAGC008_02057 [Muribaculaceae bacterium]